MTPTTPNPEDTAALLPPGPPRPQELSLPVLEPGAPIAAMDASARTGATASVTGSPVPAEPPDPRTPSPGVPGSDADPGPGPVWAWEPVGGLAEGRADGGGDDGGGVRDVHGHGLAGGADASAPGGTPGDADRVREGKGAAVGRDDTSVGSVGSVVPDGSMGGDAHAGAGTDDASRGSAGLGVKALGVPWEPSGREAVDEAAGTSAVPSPATAGRRTVVIGAETTGAIPVHLLFRDVPADFAGAGDVLPPVAGKGAGGKADGGTNIGGKNRGGTDDDEGPDTVAMAPVVPSGRRAAPASRVPVVAPSRRPAPPADPKLRERPGPVLPGWSALLVGIVALTGCAAVLHWAGAFPARLTELFGLSPRAYHGIGAGQWALFAVAVIFTLFSLGGLGRGRAGHAWVLTLFGEYRGSVRRSGLMWVSPLLLRCSVDVRLRHWRSEPMPAVDANGTALQAVVLVVWRIQDTARAVLSVADHEAYLREQVEAAMARVLSQLPTDAFHEDAPTLRNAEAVGDALTKTLSAECVPVGIDIFSAQPTRIEYAPEVAAAMRRRRIAAIEAEHRDTVLTSVVDAVDDTVQRLTVRGLVELDDYERKALVRDLTVAFCTARTGGTEGP
ncbi:SPFH domain-containing protein [Streptomyces sp. NPDC059909]|uniref:SPFH domain-containing protein n=1 Tax=Streptomyces sp. NPDC059909 TaxID=3346998 RepID=UPI00366017D5